MTTYVYWVRGMEFAEYCDLSIRSVRRVDPRAQILVYTDDTLDWKPDAQLCRQRPGRPTMVAREEAKLLALTTIAHGENVLFLDSDILMREPFPFDSESDLYLTWRDHTLIKDGEKIGREVAAAMPFNGGVIGVRTGPAAIEAFVWLKHRVLQMGQKHQTWWGDQLAIVDLVGRMGPGTYNRTLRWSLNDRGTPLRVRVLECDKWNYTPRSEDEDLTGKGIIHCKGPSSVKNLMRRLAA